MYSGPPNSVRVVSFAIGRPPGEARSTVARITIATRAPGPGGTAASTRVPVRAGRAADLSLRVVLDRVAAPQELRSVTVRTASTVEAATLIQARWQRDLMNAQQNVAPTLEALSSGRRGTPQRYRHPTAAVTPVRVLA